MKRDSRSLMKSNAKLHHVGNKFRFYTHSSSSDPAGENSRHAIKCNQVQKADLTGSHRSAAVGSN